MCVVIVSATAAGAVVLAGPTAARAERGLCANVSVKPLGSPRASYAAMATRALRAYSAPGRHRVASFRLRNENTYPTVFGIRGVVVDRECRFRWYRVQLPLRPNGVTGYVAAGSVWVGRVPTRIVVDLSDHRVTLFRRGLPVMRARAAVGADATPTPRGSFYVNQRLIPRDRRGPYGPGAIGISAFSDVLTGWEQGGPIAIHGTNRPESIGRRVTSGCIRLHNAVLRRLFRATPAGTPVIVKY
jgi:lipoprotein-anchoring transpeptidase ErfK/SrfK